jgi:hypothetical protein
MKSDKVTGAVHYDNVRSVLLRKRNDLDKSCRENQNTFYIEYLFFGHRAVNDIMWKNILWPDRPQMTKWRMDIAYWISKATNTHSEYVIIISFPLQQ